MFYVFYVQSEELDAMYDLFQVILFHEFHISQFTSFYWFACLFFGGDSFNFCLVSFLYSFYHGAGFEYGASPN